MRNDYELKSKGTSQHPHPFGAKEVCQAVGISHRQLDYWVLIGVVTPHLERHGAKLFRRFSRHDVAILQRIKKLIDEGVVVSRASERVHREMGREMATAGDAARSGGSAASSTGTDGHGTGTDAS
jgi:hypothetical protein